MSISNLFIPNENVLYAKNIYSDLESNDISCNSLFEGHRIECDDKIEGEYIVSLSYVTCNDLYTTYVETDDCHIENTIESSNSTTGALTIVGGAGIGGNVYMNKNLTVNGTLTTHNLTYENIEYVVSTDNSTSTSTGALIVAGGAGIGRDMYIGGLINSGSISSGSVSITNSTESTSISTGALKINGGVGILRNLYIGGDFNSNNATINNNVVINGSLNSTSTSTGSLIVKGGIGMNSLFSNDALFNNNVVINGTTNSTSTSTGSLIVKGGIGISNDVIIGNNMKINGTTNVYPTDTTNGALIIAGGLNVLGNVHVAGITCSNHWGYNTWAMGASVSYSNTNALLDIVPDSTGYIGSKTISDSMLFCRDYNIIKTSGDNLFSVLSGTNTRTLITLTIDGTPFTLLDGTFSGATSITNEKATYDVWYKFIPAGVGLFDIQLFGQNIYSVPLTAPIGRNGNVVMRPFYAFLNRGGLHYSRGANYTFNAYYQFDVASVNNAITLLQARAELMNIK